MGVVLEVEIPQEVFHRRVQPFGVALAEVSWRMKMFAHDGVVLSALALEEPKLLVALSFWPYREDARRYCRDIFSVSIFPTESTNEYVHCAIKLDESVVEELFVAAELLNPNPDHASARRAERHFADFLRLSFPDTLITWSRTHRWREDSWHALCEVPMRVG